MDVRPLQTPNEHFNEHFLDHIMPVANTILKPWFLYVIECQDNSLYTGVAVDVAARYALHESGKGARYTRSHPPKRLIAVVEYPDQSSALKAECTIKKLKPVKKRAFIATLLNQNT